MAASRGEHGRSDAQPTNGAVNLKHLLGGLRAISRVVGKEGKIAQRASLPGAGGGWAANNDFVNSLIADLVRPTIEVARVVGAVANGDLSQRMSLETDDRPLEGEFLR